MDIITVLRAKVSRWPLALRQAVAVGAPIAIVVAIGLGWGFTSLRSDLTAADWSSVAERFEEISADVKGVLETDETETEIIDTVRGFLPEANGASPTLHLTDPNTPEETLSLNESVFFDREGIGLTLTEVKTYESRRELTFNVYNSGQFPYTLQPDTQLIVQYQNERYAPIAISAGTLQFEPETMNSVSLRYLRFNTPAELKISDSRGETQSIVIE